VLCGAGLLSDMVNFAWSATLKGEADLTVSTVVIEKFGPLAGGPSSVSERDK
jgi:hypothetical protein